MDRKAAALADDRLDHLESQMQALMGHVKALEYGLRLLIATHPSPNVILHTLDRITDQALSTTQLVGDVPEPMYQAALHQGLGIIREQITEAVRRSR